MRKILIFFIGIFIFFSTVVVSAQNWKVAGSEHFIVYFTQDEKFTKKVLDEAEVYYRHIASDLGYPRYSEFWLWDKRVKIYIYPSHTSFLEATGQPQWSVGMADYTNKKIVGYAWSGQFLDSLLPHEMAHLIFRDFVGFKGEIPLWLDEGVAQWAEKKRRGEMKAMVKALYEEDKLLLIDDLMNLDIRRFREKDRIYIRTTRTKEGDEVILFLDTNTLVHTYYLQSFSVIGFLIEKYGSNKFAEFCRQLRDGKRLEVAFSFAYPANIRNLEQLEEKWREYLKEEY